MFIVIHMWKCRKVRTALPKIHLQKYMVSEAANYWAKKAVCFNTYMHKKRKTAHTLWWVFIMLVYRNKEKKNPFILGKQFFFPNIPLIHKLTWLSRQHFSSGVDNECYNKQEVTISTAPQRGDLHSNRQYQGNKTTKTIHL